MISSNHNLGSPSPKSPEIQGFPPLLGEKPILLVLGTMPGVQSLQRHEYYGHPRNAFWKIMMQFWGVEDPNSLNYQKRTTILMNGRVAVWDVLERCHREGSLDSEISRSTEVPNNINALLDRHPTLRTLLFNGQTAFTLFKRHILKIIPAHLPKPHFVVLPSTSPAYASLSFEKKREQWHKALREALQ